ncbi:MAG TPA: RNA-binding cell elongation regulator Jag/EloR [Anaerolineales bacterium]|nr:RNA-binding cell elongation regulator Jag/EloR [Anaerolineales bacterium]
MNERTTLEIIAPTVEEAIAQGLAELGLPADAVSVEVLDAGSKGLFGFGKHQVRVRLTVNTGGAETTQETEPVRASSLKAAAEPAEETEAPLRSDPLLDRSEAVISKLLHLLGLEAQVSAHYGESDREGRRSIHVDIRGNDLSILIGRRSETLNAFQYIASLIVGKEIEDWVQLVIDVEGYRDRREKQLIQMAKRMAEQVAKSGRRQTLEPMPSGERRIIHIALRDHPDVTTESTGEEPQRKVMIVPKK